MAKTYQVVLAVIGLATIIGRADAQDLNPSKSELPAKSKSNETSFRVWGNASGDRTVEAILLRVHDGQARLKRKDGKVFVIAVEKLSKADQQYLKLESNKNDLIKSQSSDLKVLKSSRMEECSYVVNKLVNGILIRDIGLFKSNDESTLVLVECETTFPAGRSWELSAFSLTDKSIKDRIFPAIAFELAPLRAEKEIILRRVDHGALALWDKTNEKVDFLANPTNLAGQVHFIEREDNVWPGGRIAIALLFQAPKSASDLELVKLQNVEE